jgi:hypothetical protein
VPTTTRTTSEADTRTITALMIFTVAFALVGHEIGAVKAASTQPNVQPGTDPVTVGGRILLGGTIATTLLVLVSHAGRPGRQFSLSLAVVAFFTATLVYGGPVWAAISGALSSTSGATPTSSTTPTASSTPTTGVVPTASALSNIVA